MKSKKMIMIFVAIVILIVVGIWAKNFMSVDSCLDSGGRWNHETKICEH